MSCGGVYEKDYFYQLADEYGIMIWQDFMFACSLLSNGYRADIFYDRYPTNIEFLKNVQDEVVYQVGRLNHHPSIVIWSGNNENELIIRYWPFSTNVDRVIHEADYRLLYVFLIRAIVQQLDQSRPFIASSPSNGVESEQDENYIAQNPNDSKYGDVHYYNYTVDSWNPSVYPIARFLSETGVQSLPSLESWLQVTNDSAEWNYSSRLMLHRQHHPDGMEQML
ncbi:unnamed protein product [Didymodactylos carnosus]|uniref:Glycoside hydrolase family 2 catalytic domain-containing protein n=1 Tax=Didymodactylos carnosus TaxID=1234261 RepID=A0A815VE11_9BILA|nr:unnamed protein product [Didymodactylos carnosus]CAF4394292.1 unnamed protein product [Didymodactylos carnosus]